MTTFAPMEALRAMQIGKSVAEQDVELDRYFIETEAFRALIEGRVDVIAGDKGTGKSAIYRMLQQNYRNYPEIADLEVISAFNPTGSPVFQRLASSEVYSEAVYRTIWKTYFLSLVGNWLLEIFGPAYTPEVQRLSNILEALGLENQKPDPKGVFSVIADFFKRLSNPSAMEIEFSVTETGMPIVKPGVSFDGKLEGQTLIYCDDFLQSLDGALNPVELGFGS